MKTPKKTYPEDAIAEIRQIRDEIDTEYKGDLHAMCVAATQRQKTSGRRLVNLATRKRRAATRTTAR